MENLYLPATETSPLIDFNSSSGVCKIESTIFVKNDIKSFFQTLSDWFRAFKSTQKPIILDVYIEYMWTGFESFFTHLLQLLDKLELKTTCFCKIREVLDDIEALEEIQEATNIEINISFIL